MDKLHLIMPMGGRGSRFSDHGFDCPKPLIQINKKPFFYWSTQSIFKFMEVEDIHFVVLREHVERYSIDREILKYYPDARIHIIPEVLNGAVLTCLEGIKEIHDKQPILFNDCDHMFRCSSFEQFWNEGREKEIDGALMTFLSDEPKYGFLCLDERGHVTETVEKRCVSNMAICGCYYFGNRQIFEKAAEVYLRECGYREFFLSGLFNIMAREGKIIKAFPTDFHVPFGVPEEYEKAQGSSWFEELK